MEFLMSKEELKKNLKSNFDRGLKTGEAEARLEVYGKNILSQKKKQSILLRFLGQFNDFMIIILIIAAGISAVMAYLDGTGDYIESAIIIAIVVFNAILGLVQENKAEKSLEALKKMSAPTAKVIRDGEQVIVAGEDIVPGDIIILEAGNYVPADCRLIECFNLKVDESSLTGETVPVLKNDKAVLTPDINQADMVNMAFATTMITNGHAKAIVTKTGMETKVGSIAKAITEDEAPQTPIQKKLEEVGKSLGSVCLIICALIFVIGVFKHISVREMFMTSIGLAVAAIPEGLPAIVTIMLSIGVTKMAKKNAIIRKLAAVETLGSSSIICSDKTGTLTQNKMQVLETFGETEFLLELGTMCTDSIILNTGEISGDPTENAIVSKALNFGISKEALYNKMERIGDIPFDSDRKLMTTVHKVGDKFRIITKGAVDVLLNRCEKIYINGEVHSLENIDKNIILNKNSNMADKALRVLAVAYLDVDKIQQDLDEKSLEQHLIFVGLIRNDRSTKRRCKKCYYDL